MITKLETKFDYCLASQSLIISIVNVRTIVKEAFGSEVFSNFLASGVDEWLQLNKHCPFCKKAIDEDNADDKENKQPVAPAAPGAQDDNALVGLDNV